MLKNNLFILLTVIASPAISQTLRFEDVIETIERKHPQLKMHDAEIRSMDASVAGASAWMPPEISSGFWMMPYNPKMWKKQEMGSGMGQYMVGAQQMLPVRKRQQAERNYMAAMSAVEKETKAASINQLKSDAATAYTQWIIQLRKIAVIDANNKILDFMVRNAEIRYRNNMGKLNAYYKAKAAIGNLSLMRQMAESEMAVQRIRLSALMNAAIDSTLVPDTTYQLTLPSLPVDSSTITAARSDIRAIDRQKVVNELQQQLEKARLRPEFGLKYDHMFGFGGLPQQFNLMAMVRIPMASWSSRMNKAAIQSLKFRNEALDQQKQMMILESSGMAMEMLQQIKSMQTQIGLYRDNIIPALRNNYQTMLLAYEQNTEELFMLYDAWESLNMTQMELINQQGALNLMIIQFKKTLQTF